MDNQKNNWEEKWAKEKAICQAERDRVKENCYEKIQYMNDCFGTVMNVYYYENCRHDNIRYVLDNKEKNPVLHASNCCKFFLVDEKSNALVLEPGGIYIGTEELLKKYDNLDNLAEWSEIDKEDEDQGEPFAFTHELLLLFQGLRLDSIESGNEMYLLHFDGLEVIIAWHLQQKDSELLEVLFDDLLNDDYIVHGFERHITRPCSCGGEGILWHDMLVDDWGVSCNNCGEQAGYNCCIQWVINGWNHGNTWDARNWHAQNEE